MKVVKIIKSHCKDMSDENISSFIYKNLPKEMITGLEYDDPKTITRVLKLLGIEHKSEKEDATFSEENSSDKMAAS